MASGLFGVPRARDLKRGLEPRLYDGVERVIVDRQRIRQLDPWAQGCIGGPPGRLPEGRLDCRPHIWGQPEGLAGRYVDRQPGLPAASLVTPAPMADGLKARCFSNIITRPEYLSVCNTCSCLLRSDNRFSSHMSMASASWVR